MTSHTMKIKLAHGLKVVELRVPADSDFKQVKAEVLKATGVPVKDQKLLLRGREVDDGSSVYAAGLRDNGKLMLIESEERRRAGAARREAGLHVSDLVKEAMAATSASQGGAGVGAAAPKTTLYIKFPEGYKLPQEYELRDAFRRFGQGTETVRVWSKTSTGSATFKRSFDCVAAFNHYKERDLFNNPHIKLSFKKEYQGSAALQYQAQRSQGGAAAPSAPPGFGGAGRAGGPAMGQYGKGGGGKGGGGYHSQSGKGGAGLGKGGGKGKGGSGGGSGGGPPGQWPSGAPMGAAARGGPAPSPAGPPGFDAPPPGFVHPSQAAPRAASSGWVAAAAAAPAAAPADPRARPQLPGRPYVPPPSAALDPRRPNTTHIGLPQPAALPPTAPATAVQSSAGYKVPAVMAVQHLPPAPAPAPAPANPDNPIQISMSGAQALASLTASGILSTPMDHRTGAGGAAAQPAPAPAPSGVAGTALQGGALLGLLSKLAGTSKNE